MPVSIIPGHRGQAGAGSDGGDFQQSSSSERFSLQLDEGVWLFTLWGFNLPVLQFTTFPDQLSDSSHVCKGLGWHSKECHGKVLPPNALKGSQIQTGHSVRSSRGRHELGHLCKGNGHPRSKKQSVLMEIVAGLYP